MRNEKKNAHLQNIFLKNKSFAIADNHPKSAKKWYFFTGIL
jgi:hypothetical protein